MEGLKEALQYVAGLAEENTKTEVVEICGRTYANRNLTRYDKILKADPVGASSLSALVDYIATRSEEFPEGRNMILHIVSPKKVRLVSGLDVERGRECLFVAEAEVSEFNFGRWYDQESFIIELQANFSASPDREILLKVAGNVEQKNDQSFADDGVTQVVTMKTGIAQKGDVIVPNPVGLVPYRTFQEVDQPSSQFVFRIRDNGEPAFMLLEAQNQIWKNEAVANIKGYLKAALLEMPEEINSRITVIG